MIVTVKRAVLSLLFFSLLTLSGALWFAHTWLHDQRFIEENSRALLIEKGDTLYGVVRRMDFFSKSWQQTLVVTYARLLGLGNIKQGEYELPIHLSPITFLNLLNDGKVKLRSFTWVEGITVEEALTILRQQPLMAQPEPPMTQEALQTELKIDHPHIEGWLFPDTYFYHRGVSPWQLVTQAHQKMKVVLAQEWSNRQIGLPYETPYEALIMASIIEKETGAPSERAEIAGVFVRRLQQGMRLQTDPTVIYGLGARYQGNLTRRHLREATDYNTYTINGLPPTPIALPGRAAIHAALHPAEGQSLYFVARGDGTHYFSNSLDEHLKAVKQYQLQRVKDYRSSVSQ